MASRASLLVIMLQASFLALALSCCLHKANGLESSATEDAASALVDPASSKSTFVRRQLTEKPQMGKGTFFNQCLFNCALTPLFPTCCPFLGVGFCVSTLTNPSHCGVCGNICPIGTICCFGKCVSTLTDRNNCGICGKVCPFPGTCKFGLCNYNGKLI